MTGQTSLSRLTQQTVTKPQTVHAAYALDVTKMLDFVS